MTEEIEKKVLSILMEVKDQLVTSKSEYCFTEEALLLIGLKDYRDLKTLVDMNIGFRRYQRKGSSYVYKKSECRLIAEMLDNKEITI